VCSSRRPRRHWAVTMVEIYITMSVDVKKTGSQNPDHK
jgi:hypothetical protein